MSGTKIEWVIEELRKGCRKWHQVDMFGTETLARKDMDYRSHRYDMFTYRLIKRTTTTTEEVIQ